MKALHKLEVRFRRMVWVIAFVCLCSMMIMVPPMFASDAQALLPSEAAEEAKRINAEAVQLYRAGKYAEAEPLALKVLQLRERSLGPEHPNTAVSLNNLADLYRLLGDYGKAEPLLLRALKIKEKALGSDHPSLAQSVNTLANNYSSNYDYEKAEPLYQRALKIREQIFGPGHPSSANTLNDLAELYQRFGDYRRAEPLYQRSLSIKEKALGPDDPETARSLRNLARLYQDTGDYTKAEPLQERALRIMEKAWGLDHPDTAASLNSLAGLYQIMANYAKAEPLMQRALNTSEVKSGPESPSTAVSLNNLAVLYLGMADYAKAEPLLKRALRIWEKAFGPDHPETTASLNNLAMLCQSRSDYAGAELLFQQALKIRQKALGPEHPNTAVSLNNLALLSDAKRDFASGEAMLRRGIDIIQRQISATATVQSERQQLAMADYARKSFHAWLSVALRAERPAAELAEAELQWKGQVTARQQAYRRLRESLERSGDAAARALFDQLDLASRSLANQSSTTPEPGPKAEQRQKRLNELAEQKDALSRDLARKSAFFREFQQCERTTLAELRTALGRRPGTVLVDFLEYQHVNPPKPGQGTNTFEQRLLAFVLCSDTVEVAMVELGLAEPISKLVDQWRINWGMGQESQAAGQQLRHQVWAKLEPKLGGAKAVLLSPDGALCRLPFGALPGSKAGTYLIEEYSLAVLPVPRLLPQMIEEATSARSNTNPSLLAVGDVDYGADPGAAGDGARAGMRGKGTLPTWGNLPGTRSELGSMVGRFKERFPAGAVTELRLAAATEQAFRVAATSSPYLHLATHGFFAAKDDKQDQLRHHLNGQMGLQADGRDLFGGRGVSAWNPGLLSGVVLAGANHGSQDGKDDGILTALEVESLDLRGVNLAVLSACETGLGEAARGEGVLGLQRAFQLAGARTTVTSLWKVSDEATQALMKEFYRRLWEQKQGKLEALRGAQVAMLRGQVAADGKPLVAKNRGAQLDGELRSSSGTSPYFWAAFVLSGDWR